MTSQGNTNQFWSSSLWLRDTEGYLDPLMKPDASTPPYLQLGEDGASRDHFTDNTPQSDEEPGCNDPNSSRRCCSIDSNCYEAVIDQTLFVSDVTPAMATNNTRDGRYGFLPNRFCQHSNVAQDTIGGSLSLDRPYPAHLDKLGTESFVPVTPQEISASASFETAHFPWSANSLDQHTTEIPCIESQEGIAAIPTGSISSVGIQMEGTKQRQVEPPLNLGRPRNIHDKLYLCSIDGCEKTFTLKRDLARHRVYSQAHQEFRSTEKWICSDEKCKSFGKSFTRQDNYQRHVRTIHIELDEVQLPTAQG